MSSLSFSIKRTLLYALFNCFLCFDCLNIFMIYLQFSLKLFLKLFHLYYQSFRAGPYIGLILIAIGTGGIKPCVSAFGGDQFEAGQVCYFKQIVNVFFWFFLGYCLCLKSHYFHIYYEKSINSRVI